MVKCKDCDALTDHPGGYCKPCYFKIKDSKNGVAKPKFKENKLSEGEEFIIDFLEMYDITFKSQHKIENLKGDRSAFRVADFYLPKYDVYIEFFGQWNVPDHQNRYKAKRDLYFRNKIPCIYLYPENLGILPFVFDKRLQEVLSSSGRSKQLRKYRLYKLNDGEGYRLGFIGFCLFILPFIDYKAPSNNFVFILAGAGLIGYQVYRLIKAYRQIFIKNCYPLNNLN